MISQERIPQRFVDPRRPQKAEQLVEVPTVVSFSSLEQQTAKEIIDIPLPRTRGCHGDLQNFLPGQGSLQRTVDQIVNIPAGGGLQGFLLDPGSAGPSAASCEERGSPSAARVHSGLKCEYLQCSGVRWVRQWVLAWEGYAWWLVDDHGSWHGPESRPPWELPVVGPG